MLETPSRNCLTPASRALDGVYFSASFWAGHVLVMVGNRCARKVSLPAARNLPAIPEVHEVGPGQARWRPGRHAGDAVFPNWANRLA